MSKAELRARLRKLRRGLPRVYRLQASAEIARKLLALEFYAHARAIHIYVSWQEEVDTHELIRARLQADRRVLTPKINPTTKSLEHYVIPHFHALVPGAFGILEPSREHGAVLSEDFNMIDLIIVPGLGFDRKGNRLGYGGGYYDRVLAEIATPKVALAFAAQVVNTIPAEAHDQGVDFIITEREVISCRQV